jgi:uncharacterized repeat protein (TIGR01451 family)
MSCRRWFSLFMVVLSTVAAMVLLSSLLFYSEAQAQSRGPLSPVEAAVSPVLPLSSTSHPAPPVRLRPTAPDPRTLTTPLPPFQPPQTGWLPEVQAERAATAIADTMSPAALNPQSLPAGITVDLVYHVVMGWANPGDLIAVTTPTGHGTAVADGVGFFWTPIWHADGHPIGINVGEPLVIFVNGALTHSVTPPQISGGIDVLNDTVTGQIDGDGGGTAVTLTMGVWAQLPAPGAPTQTAITQGDGSFSAPFGEDLGAQMLTTVDLALAGVNIRTCFYPDPAVFLVQQYDSIAGYAPPGQPVYATVYAAYPGNVRWSGETSAEWPHGFYRFGAIGWGEADIETGDVVEVMLAGGVTLSTTVANLNNLAFDVAREQLQGSAPTGATVRASLWQWQGGDSVYHEAHAIAGAGDQFTLAFAADLRPRDEVEVVIADANGHQIQLLSGPAYLSAWNDPYSNNDCIFGRLDGPNLPITVSLTTPGQTFVRDTGWNSDAGNRLAPCFLIRAQDWSWGPINFEPGDIATLQSPTWQGDVEIITAEWQADTAANSINGDAPAGDLLITLRQWQEGHYPLYGAAAQTAVANSPFTANFANFDVRDGAILEWAHYNPATGYANQTAAWGENYLSYFEVALPHGVGGFTTIPDDAVTASLYDETHALLATTSHDHDDRPHYFWLSDFSGYPFQPGYWITLTSASGWTAGLQIPDLLVDGNPETDMVTAVGPAGLLFLDGGREGSGFGGFVPGPDAVINATAFGHDLQWGDEVGVTWQSPDGNRVQRRVRLGELLSVEFWFDPIGQASLWGAAKANAPVTITTPYDQIVLWSDPHGGWNTNEPLELHPGDTVLVAADASLFPVTIPIPDPIAAQADSTTNEVWGQIGGWHEQMVQIHGFWPDGYQEVTTDVAGQFSAMYPDIPRGANGYIRWEYMDGITAVRMHRPFATNDLILRVNYDHEWVEGNYETGHTLWLTLTDSLGNVKTTAAGETGEIPWWGGQTGFSTNYNIHWSGPQPDIAPGDWVYAALDNGQTASVQIGVIEGELDLDNDSVSGTVHVPWFNEPLNLHCAVWEDGGPWMDTTVDPNGGAYVCDFGALGWDLQPGHMVGVQYQEPDGDWVVNVFEEPVARLFITQWSQGQPAEGGNFTFRIEYLNEGGASAENTVITATLHGFAFLGDSSGFPHTTGVTPGGDPYVAWELGTVDAHYGWATFDLFAEVTAVTGDSVSHIAQIGTSNPYNNSDPAMLTSVWEGEVVPNDAWVNIGKGAWTWNPLPGYDFVYNVNVCNHGSTASGSVTITDTLPLSTTLVSWWGQDAGWQEVTAGDHLLVVERPSLNAWSCSELYLRVHLSPDAWPGLELVNTAVVHANNDLSPDDNEVTIGHHVDYPSRDLSIGQSWHWGMLVPGGHYRLGLHAHNNGNLPADGPVYVTATLPAGTSFAGWHSWGWTTVTLHEATADHVVWKIDGLDNGYYAGIELALDIAPTVTPGTALVNPVAITLLPDETNTANNVSAWEEMVYGHGPNLRLRKFGDWHGHGEGHNAWYRLEVENIGDQPVTNVTVTDTYPAGMELDGDPHVGFWQGWEWANHPAAHFFTVTLETLEPTWNVHIHYNTVIPGEQPVPPGLLFSNTAAVETPADDANPADNSAALTLFTGPDFFIEKHLAGGEFLPGELITWHLRFGNGQVGHAWWWNPQGNAWISDTLPAGMSFVAAYQHWCGGDIPDWCDMPPDAVNGQTVGWRHWFPGGAHNELLIVAQISPTATGMDSFENVATIAGDQPDVDVETDYTNNSASHSAAINLPYFTIRKSFAGSQIVGQLVTYTLTVENPGNAVGTGLVITDALPTNVTWVSGGSYDAGTQVISWSVAEVLSGESAEVQFTGRVRQGETAVNQWYRVIGSDQGVYTGWGEPVSFVILPDIRLIYLPLITR